LKSLERLKDAIFIALIFGVFGLILALIGMLNYLAAVLITGLGASCLVLWELKHVSKISLFEITVFLFGGAVSVFFSVFSPFIFLFAFLTLVVSKKFPVSFLCFFLGLGLGAGVEVLYKRDLLSFFFNLVCAIAFDSAAFYVGSAFGGYKLAPSISPNKTWAGVFGGALAFLTVALGWHVLIKKLRISFLLLPVFYVCGDLLKSQVKRCLGIKDFSLIFKSHGGIIDRVDSNLAGLILVNAAM